MKNKRLIETIIEESVLEGLNQPFDKSALQSINDRIYELVDYKIVPEEDEDAYSTVDRWGSKRISIFDDNHNEYDSIEDYNSSIIEQTIDQVLEELKMELLQNWGIKG